MEDGQLPLFNFTGAEERTGNCAKCSGRTDGELCSEHPDAGIDMTLTSDIVIRTLPAIFNPFMFFEALDYLNQVPVPGSDQITLPPSAEQILAFLCRKASKHPDKIARRWRESAAAQPNIVLNTDFTKAKLLEPMQQAQANFILGNWYSVVMLCGVVSETLAMFMVDIATPHLLMNGKPLSSERQKLLFGSEINDLTQERRLKILLSLNVIDADVYHRLDTVRDLRNRYVHPNPEFNPSDETQREHAQECLQHTGSVFAGLMAHAGPDGTVQLHPWVEQHLIDLGVLPGTVADGKGGP